MERLPILLICDDDRTHHMTLRQMLKGKYDFKSAYNGDEALIYLKKQTFAAILLDVEMRTKDEGFQFLPIFKQTDLDLRIIISTGKSDFNTVREALRLGAHDYVLKEFDEAELTCTIDRVLQLRKLSMRSQQQNFETQQFQKKHVMIGESPPLNKLRKIVEKVKTSTSNILIYGETGTGKEVIARQIRQQLADGSLEPFVAVDSATIQSSTAESLLFGHEKGAFTGADKATKGIFEEANGGIVYFDEIANMPLDIQVKLLRVLQEKEITRLGSSKVIELDFRVICATNRNLQEMVDQKLFKEDLLQRITVIPIYVPRLKERKEDIPLLIEYFSEQHRNNTNVRKKALGQETASEKLEFSDEAIDVLKHYSLPGNVRELGNLVAYLATMSDDNRVEIADIPHRVRDDSEKQRRNTESSSNNESGAELQYGEGKSFYDQIAELEKKILNREYQKHFNNISKMALLLGMDRSHLYSKLKEHGLHQPHVRKQ